MKKILMSVILLIASMTANAAPVTVNFAFDSIATGSFSFDSALDGTVIDYTELNSFQLAFSGPSNSVYDLAFVNAGNSTVWHFFKFDSAIDAFLTETISGFPTTIADIKNSFGQGFFVRDDLKVIRNYAPGGSQQYYSNLTISVDRNAVPEPGTLAMLGLGLGLFGFASIRNRKQ